MCGRYNIITDAHGLYDAFKLISNSLNFEFFTPNFNIHPSPAEANEQQLVMPPMIRWQNKQYEALPAVWPLIPKWAKGRVSKYSTANAKAETLATIKSYQHAWKSAQRCLIPATGFYEWQVVAGEKHKQPYNIRLAEQAVFAMAGLWEQSLNPQTQHIVESFTIITTQANPMMAKIHNTKERMPVIISPENYTNWLQSPIEEAQFLLKPFPEQKMTAYKVSTYVNNPNNDDEKCIEPI